jgi:hypothetical protein
MSEEDRLPRVNRRRALAAIGTGAGTVVGLEALSERAIAWDRFDLCFRGCGEVWMIVAHSDVDAGGTGDPPPVAHVIVALEGEAVCRAVEFTAENVTTMPDRFGRSPVVTYSADTDETILGVLEYNYTTDEDARFDDPVWCVHANQNECATTPETPDLLGAPCVPDDHPTCPATERCGDSGGVDGQIQVAWENCETVMVTGDGEGLESIVVHPLRCFPGDGPCPDGVPGGRTIEDPELPLTIDDRYLAIDGEEVPYYIAAIELQGDVEQDAFGKPDHLDCSFEEPTAIDSCTDITEPGSYELVTDLQPAERAACLQILVDNVTIDGNGHRIDGSALPDSTDSTGILIDTSADNVQEAGGGAEQTGTNGVNVRDVRVEHFTDGASLVHSECLVIEDTDLRENDHAIDAADGNDMDLRSVLIEDNGAVADEFWAFGEVAISDSEIRDNGTGLVVFDGTLTVEASTIEDNGGVGVRVSDMGPGVRISDTTIQRNTGVGIGYRFASPDLQTVILADNDGLELDQGPESELTAGSLTIGDSPTLATTALPDPLSLDDIDPDDLPALPDDVDAAGPGLDVTIQTGTIDARFQFDAADGDQVELWRYDGTAWERVQNATVDDGTIGATLRLDGIYAPVIVSE